MSNSHPFLRAGFFVLAAFLAFPCHAAKTDIVTLINGNTITGEIKALDFGALRYSTDSMGTVSIDWEDIVNIASNRNLQIELTDGSRYFGSLLMANDDFHIRIRTASKEIELPSQQIVRITPIEQGDRFWQNLEGSFSLGFQAQKSSEVATSNVNIDVYRRARKFLVGLQVTSAVTDQPTEQTKARQSAQINYQRFRGDRWFTDWFTSFEKNDELGIRGRTSAGGAVGRYIMQTNRNQLSLTGGLQAARTSYTGADESATEAEGRIEIRYLHRSLIPDASIMFTTKIYPLLDDLSQIRAESDLSFRREFLDDFYLDLTIGHSYLSQPPDDASSTDYNVTTSLGYSF